MKIFEGINKTFVISLFLLLISSIFLAVLPDKNIENSSKIALTKTENKIWIASNQWTTSSIKIYNVCDGQNQIRVFYKNTSKISSKNNTNCFLEITKNVKNIQSIEVKATKESGNSYVLINREKKEANSKRLIGLIPLIIIFIFLLTKIKIKRPNNSLANFHFGIITLWAVLGPTQYDENWIAFSAASFTDFTWFSNIYTAGDGPIPQGFLFNVITLMGLIISNSLFTTRILWAVSAAIGLILFLRILDSYKLGSRARVVVSAQYILCVLFLAGGWRPEILIIVLWNYLILQLKNENISTKSKVLISIAVGVSITTGQAGIGAISFLMILLFKKLISLLDFGYMTLLTLLTGLTLTFAQAGPQLILEGINGFRSSSTHSGNRIVGEVNRYSSVYYSVDSLGTLLAVTFVVVGALLALISLNRNSLLVLFPMLIIFLSASKWVWHIAPLITPIIVFLLSMDKSKRVSHLESQQLKKIYLIFATVLVWASSFGFQESGYFPEFATLMTTVPAAIIASVLVFQLYRSEINFSSFLNKNYGLILATYLIVFVSFIISSYSWKTPLVGPILSRIAGSNCAQLDKYYLMDENSLLPVAEFNPTQESFSESIVLNRSEANIRLNNSNKIFKPENSRYVIYLNFPKGGTISVVDQHDDFIEVRDFQGSIKPLSGTVFANHFKLNDFRTLKNVYIPPSSAYQEFHFEDFRKIPTEIKIQFTSAGSYRYSTLYIASLISGNREVISTKNVVISPPLVPILGCNSTIKAYQSLPQAPEYILYIPGKWLKESDQNYTSGINNVHVYLNKSVFLEGEKESVFTLGKKL